MRVLSLGAGVQSSALYLMALAGELDERPDFAIFADTHGEPDEVYSWLEYLEYIGGESIPIVRVSAGDLMLDFEKYADGRADRVAMIPLFVESDKTPGVAAKVFRQCTADYKIAPIKAHLRDMGASAADPAEVWLGISIDEIARMKPSRVRYMVHRWPLVERRMSRHDCLLWMERHGYDAPPRSACTFCPFRSNAEWSRLRASDPDAWDEVVRFDRAVRRLPKMRGRTYLHRSLMPIEDVDFDDPQVSAGQKSLWGDWVEECEGMCGL